jgi:TPR repeat protein
MRQADARYQEGVELERRGDLRAAVAAYQQAGESGHGLAQKKLGDFYGTGNDVVERDYETSLRWYERARQQGIEIPKPFTYPGVRR